MSLKILTFNIHKGFNWNNTQLTLHRLKENLSQINPDIVFLQEVVGENTKHATNFEDWIDDQFQFLAQDLWKDFVYSKHAIYDHRHHGNAILSKYAITQSKVIDISQNRFEQRSILFCEVDLGHKKIHTYCVHLNLLHKDRVEQYQKINAVIGKMSPNQEHIILAGDFNDWNLKASPHLFGENELHDAYKSLHKDYPKTFPSFFPFIKLDRIYTRGLKIEKAEVLKKDWVNISDHLPLYIEVDLL